MYLLDRDLFVRAAGWCAALLCLASAVPRPDEFFRRAQDVQASPELPPGSPYSPPDEGYFASWRRMQERWNETAGGGGGDGMNDHETAAAAAPESAEVGADMSGAAAHQNPSSQVNYGYKDIFRLGG